MTTAVTLTRTRISCLSGLALALGGCVSGDDFASLSRRPAERIEGAAAPAPTSSAPTSSRPATAPSIETTTQLAQLQDTARAAHQRFAARRAAAERAASGAGPLGSESWANASIALAGLEEAYDQQSTALTGIDQLQAEQQVVDAGIDGPDATAIKAARDSVLATADADGEVVTRLRARLGK